MVEQRTSWAGRDHEEARRRHGWSTGRIVSVGGAASLVAAISLGATALVSGASGGAAGAVGLASPTPFLNGLNTVTTIAPSAPQPGGDVNPYGVAVVPTSKDELVAGDVLVSNFNNSANSQGTGTTIVQIPPGDMDQNAGDAPVFAQIDPTRCRDGARRRRSDHGARRVTPRRVRDRGSLPTTDGSPRPTAEAGCLLVLNSHGRVVETIAGGRSTGRGT